MNFLMNCKRLFHHNVGGCSLYFCCGCSDVFSLFLIICKMMTKQEVYKIVSFCSINT